MLSVCPACLLPMAAMAGQVAHTWVHTPDEAAWEGALVTALTQDPDHQGDKARVLVFTAGPDRADEVGWRCCGTAAELDGDTGTLLVGAVTAAHACYACSLKHSSKTTYKCVSV